jgi:hypothetical protein
MASESTRPSEGGAPGEGREHPAETRTTWAEEQAAKFCGFPLAAETVFLRTKYQRGGEKEVCDLLLALRGEAIVLSLKHQEDPDSRTGDRLARWCKKAAEAAVGQLIGAVKTIQGRPFWCDHAKRGRVDFKAGVLQVRHAIACVEAGQGIELPLDLPEDARGTPVTYMTSSDLLNVVKELHSFPDIVRYLDARLKLPRDLRRSVGLEEALYSYYLLNDESFDGCRSFEDVIAALDADGGDLKRKIAEKHEADFSASIIESVSYSLAGPPGAGSWSAAGVSATYDEERQRTEYTTIQECLCNLRLVERRLIGEKFIELRRLIAGRPKDLVYSSSHSDGKDFVYVLAVARGLDRAELLERAEILLIAGMAFYGKTHGMVIIERDGVAHLTMMKQGGIDSAEALAAGKELFGRLKTTHTPIRLLPADGYTTEP